MSPPRTSKNLKIKSKKATKISP